MERERKQYRFIENLLKVIFIVCLVAINMINICYYLVWIPGYENFNNKFVKDYLKNEQHYLAYVQNLNNMVWDVAPFLVILTIYLFVKYKKYRWFAFAGLITILGLALQEYIFKDFV